MTFQTLPNEILLRIAWFIPKCATCHCPHLSHDLSALSRCSRHLHSVLAPELARTSSAEHIVLWAIWHNRPDTVSLAIKRGVGINVVYSENHNVTHLTYSAVHGTALEIAIRNRLRPMDPMVAQMALEICTVLLSAGGKLRTDVLRSIITSGDTDLLRCCVPYITDINARTNTLGLTLLAVADSEGRDEMAALLSAAGAVMDGTGHYRPMLECIGVQRQIPMDGRPVDFRLQYPGWELGVPGALNEWGPVCMMPRLRSGCLCPWCPVEVTGGYSVLLWSSAESSVM